MTGSCRAVHVGELSRSGSPTAMLTDSCASQPASAPDGGPGVTRVVTRTGPSAQPVTMISAAASSVTLTSGPLSRPS